MEQGPLDAPTADSLAHAHEPARPNDAMSISARFGLERMRARLSTGEPATLRVGRDGRFALRECLGRGGMGEVYLARDTLLGREVALKVVAAKLRHSSRLRRRLLREARMLAALDHPNVLEVYDIDTTDAGELFIAMEYIEGSTLARWQIGRSLREIVAAYASAGQGLAAAHSETIIHRDFKPANVLIARSSNRVVVGDFGLAGSGARPDDHDSQVEIEIEAEAADELTTAPGALLGTPAYMAPELFAGQPASFASDQYSFCTALWEALTGGFPRPRPGPDSNQARAPLRPRTLPRWLYRVLRRGLAERPEHRFAGMPALLSALVRGQRAQRMLGATSLATPMLAGALALAWFTRPTDPCVEVSHAIDSIWNAETEQRIRSALERLEPGEQRAGGYASGVLDAAAERWQSDAKQTCEALERSPTKRELVARQACHERWLTDFASRVELLEHPSVETLRYVHHLLEPLDRAGDPCELASPPINPKVHDLLDGAEESQSLRDFTSALALADRALTLAEQVARPCLPQAPYSVERGEARYRIAEIQADREDGAQAQVAIQLAIVDAIGCEHQELFVRARTLEAEILALDLELPEQAQAALDQAQAALDQLGAEPDDLHRHELSKARGFAALARGDYLDAVHHYEDALALLGEGELALARRSKLYANIGAALQDQGDQDGARRANQRALDLLSNALGPDHPEVRIRRAQANFNLALISIDQGEFDEARVLLEQVAALDDPAHAIKARVPLVQALARAERPEDADAEAGRLAAALADAEFLPPRTRAEALTVAGKRLAKAGPDQGGPGPGLDLLARALATWEQHFPDDPNRDACEVIYAVALVDAGRFDAARPHLDALDARLAPDHEFRALIRELAETIAETIASTRERSDDSHH